MEIRDWNTENTKFNTAKMMAFMSYFLISRGSIRSWHHIAEYGKIQLFQ